MTETLTQPEPHPDTHHTHEADDDHDHHDHHAGPEPVISQRWKWMTVLGNAAIGAGELATGNLSTMSVTADGLHNVGDTATYYMQAENILDQSKNEQKKMRLRKIAHWVIVATSLSVSAKAGLDLALDHESTPHAATIYAAGASLALNGLMLTRLRKGIRRNKASHESVYERDLSKHFWAVDIPSAGLAVAGAALQRYNVDIEQVAAIASGVVGAYAFRPTRANLAHNCLDHDHGASESAVAHDHNHRLETVRHKSWPARMAYKPRHQRPTCPVEGEELGGRRSWATAGNMQTRRHAKPAAGSRISEGVIYKCTSFGLVTRAFNSQHHIRNTPKKRSRHS